MIKPGDLVDGKYSVTRVMGQGGMGMVVEAYRQELDMHVAIKFMRSDMIAANGGTERFLREAQALVKLKSQHAVKVHDLGIHRRMPYIVMEHLEGMDMQTMLDKHGPLSVADAARHVRQACEAIAEAHSLGIYHRDLKPANLFLAQGASGRIIVKVLDFGIAKVMRPAEGKAALYNSLTGATTLIGTVPYMSPEQLVSPKDIDGRADIWSLGVVLYELVTGELPFGGRDLYEMQQAIRHGTCVMPTLPTSLQPIIRRCLQKNRDDRYPSAVELALALRPLVNESLSPFGAMSERAQSASPQAVVVPDAPGSPRSTVRSSVDLVMAEGLPVSKAPQTITVRLSRTPRIEVFAATVSAANPGERDTSCARANVALRGTVIMAPETPEPPTLKRLPSHRPVCTIAAPQMPQAAPQNAQPVAPRAPALGPLQMRVETVRRGVLVVKQPLKLSRRRRSTLRTSKLTLGALTVCALAFALVWPSQQSANAAMSWMSSFVSSK